MRGSWPKTSVTHRPTLNSLSLIAFRSPVFFEYPQHFGWTAGMEPHQINLVRGLAHFPNWLWYRVVVPSALVSRHSRFIERAVALTTRTRPCSCGAWRPSERPSRCRAQSAKRRKVRHTWHQDGRAPWQEKKCAALARWAVVADLRHGLLPQMNLSWICIFKQKIA